MTQHEGGQPKLNTPAKDSHVLTSGRGASTLVGMTVTQNQARPFESRAANSRLAVLLALVSTLLSSCLSYRANYKAEVEVDTSQDVSAAKSPLAAAPAATSPAAPLESDKAVFVYYYGANFSMGAAPLGCALTVWLYGGLCWLYLENTPFSEDALQLQKDAEENLAVLLAGRKYRLLGIDYEKVARVRDEPYYLLANSEDQVLAEGPAPATRPWSTQASAPVAKAAPPDKAMPVFSSFYTFRAAKLSRFYGSGTATSTVVDAWGQEQVVASGRAGFSQTTFEIFDLKPEGWGYGFMPSYAYRRLAVADFARDLPFVEVAGSENIPVVVTDPNSRQKIDLSAYTNAYSVVSQATAMLVGVTYNSTGGLAPNYKGNMAAFDVGLWLGMVEYLSNELHYQSHRAKKNYWDFANEIRLDANYFFVMPSINSAIGVHAQYSHLPKLRLPRSVEFRGPPSYRADKQVYERQRVFVDQVKVEARSWGLSYSYLFKQAE